MAGTQKTNLINVLRHAASSSHNARVMLGKVLKRFDGTGKYGPAENQRWIDANRIDPSVYAKARDPELWGEALDFGQRLRDRAKPVIDRLPFDIGAGGDYQFLYWLTRHLRPAVVVETGVAAGWSSHAFLAAMDVNGAGRLYSSDFPLFRVADPVQYVGILVDDGLKDRWQLHVDGDEFALPRIMADLPQVDIFHYDSDKSRSGRQFAYDLVAPKLTGPLLYDDIQNDSSFRELVERLGRDFTVFVNATEHTYGLIEPA
mgnify:CR=1 FL=1